MNHIRIPIVKDRHWWQLDWHCGECFVHKHTQTDPLTNMKSHSIWIVYEFVCSNALLTVCASAVVNDMQRTNDNDFNQFMNYTRHADPKQTKASRRREKSSACWVHREGFSPLHFANLLSICMHGNIYTQLVVAGQRQQHHFFFFAQIFFYQ